MKPSKSSIARRVRSNLECYADEFGYCDNLMGLCALGSVALHFAFMKAGHSSKVIWGMHPNHGCHCFVESNGIIWDITATQFRFCPPDKRVFVTKVSDTTYQGWYTNKFRDPRPGIRTRIHHALPMKLKQGFEFFFADWADEERPSRQNILKILR